MLIVTVILFPLQIKRLFWKHTYYIYIIHSPLSCQSIFKLFYSLFPSIIESIFLSISYFDKKYMTIIALLLLLFYLLFHSSSIEKSFLNFYIVIFLLISIKKLSPSLLEITWGRLRLNL